MSKFFKNRKLITISISSLFLIVASIITIVAICSNNKKTNPKFKYNSGYYITDQEAIETSSLASQYVKMNTLYTNTGSNVTGTNITFDTNKKIAIESAMDFYAFTVLANRTPAFLGYKYELLTNIDMKDAYTVYPIGYQNKVFTGSFNGNGHTIKNLDLQTVVSGNKTNFDDTHYYALFCQNKGTVANFGLIDPKISINVTPAADEQSTGIFYVSNVVGKNTGEVAYVFVRDNQEEDKKKTPGIDLIEAGFHISGLVAVNAQGGKFDNSYYVSSTVISSNNNKPAEFQEILLENKGTLGNNLFFYNSLIENYTPSAIRYGGFLDKTINYIVPHYGTYEPSISELNEDVLGTNSSTQLNTWYMGANYENVGDLATFFDSVITPLTRGFKSGQVTYDENAEKYHVTISNPNDFSYVYELMDLNSKFASNAFIYELDPKDDEGNRVSGINLDNVLSPKYSNGIAATFTTKNAIDDSDNATLYLNSFSYKVTTLGIDAYGVFPYLTGTVKYLNFVVGGSNELEFSNVSTNINAYGAIAGYAEGATIDHCNVFNNFKITSKVGKYFAGGAVGILAGESTISNVTTAGELKSENTNPKTITNPSNYPNGSIIGGVVGYIDSSLGSVDTLYNEATITAQGYTNQEFVVGGVIGAGYTINANRLQNNGSITVSNSAYTKLYTAGVIGRLLGVSNQITLFTNNGDINVTQINAPTYVSGVLNADIQTSDTIAESIFKQKSVFYFYASCLTNGANVTVSGTKATTYMLTDVINVLNNNGFITKLSGVYNLNYKFNSPSTSLIAKNINTNLFNSYAPLLTSNSNSSSNYIDLQTAYNLRDITLTQTGQNTSNLLYTGCVLGDYISYTDVRNEGNISFTVNNQITGDIKIFGIFNELSNGQAAKANYNGGNIELILKANVTGNIYLSGICYANKNHTDSKFYLNSNPLDSTFNKDYRGTIDNVINAGDITFGLNDILTSNDKTVSANPSAYSVSGNVLISGISILNESSITNTFNLGDILAANELANNAKSITSGIACVQSGSNASIINSANNGDIKNINMSQTGFIYSSGIVGKNDSTISFDEIESTSNNHSQNIAFTINYGSILGFNGVTNTQMSPTEFSTINSTASGIISSGVCNIVNVVNYGKIYGSQIAGGIIGACDFSKFENEVNQNSQIYISNCLTYAATYQSTKTISAAGFASPIYYNEVRDLNSTRADVPVVVETPSAVDFAYNGTVIALINFANSDSAQYINIRYLVSFPTIVQAFRLQINRPTSVVGQTNTMYSANTNQMYLGGALIYSPLSTLNDEYGNVGIFNENFRFRRAIEGKIEDGTEYFNTSRYVTDLYLTDFFEFVGFTKVNPYILNKIGWDTISYSSAASDFIKNLSELEIIIKAYKQQDSNGFNTLLQKAFNTSTWIAYCDQSVLSSLLEELLNAQDLASLKTITNYLFFESANKSSITVAMREAFATTLINEFNSSSINLREFLDSIMTEMVFAKIISANDADNQIVKSLFEQYISALTNETKIELVYKYLNYLETNHYDELFSSTYKDYYSSEKIELLTTLLSSLDTDIIVDLASNLDLTTSESSTYKLKIALDSLTNAQKTTLYNQFITDLSNNTTSVVDTVKTAITSLLSTYDIASYTEETDTTETNAFYTSIDSNAERVALWNIIKNDNNVINYLDEYYRNNDMYVTDANTGAIHTGFLAKATEYRNTYQSNDTPSGYTWAYNASTGISTTTQGVNNTDVGKFYTYAYNNGNAIAQNLRFIYVPDELVADGATTYTYRVNGTNYNCTPTTYFYGPYLSATVNSDYSGQLWNYSATEGAVAVGRNVNLNTGGDGSITMYTPFFCSLDESYINNEIAKTQFGSAGINGVSTSYPFVWNSIGNNNQSTQWVSQDIMTTAPGDSIYLQKKDNVTINGKNYNYNYNLMSSTSYNQLNSMGLVYAGVNNTNISDKSTLLYGYISCSIITGIYGMFDQWGTNGIFFTAKTSYNKYGIVTSQYIDYTINDLINVDGKLTKGQSKGGDSTDEIQIINQVMQHLFATNKGKSVVMTALGKHFASTGVDNVQLALNYLNAFTNNQTWKNEFLSKIPFTPDTYNVRTNIGTVSTVEGYLEGIYNGLTHSDYQNIILHSLDNKANFTKVLQYLLDRKYGYYNYIQSLDGDSYYDWFNNTGDYVTKEYTSTELQYLVNYILANNTSQLDTIISGVSDTEINNVLQATLTNTYDLSNKTLSGYTFGNNGTAVLDYNSYGGTNYYSAINFDGNSTISFETGNYSGLKLNVIAYGNGSISIGETSYNVTNTPTQYTFNLNANTEYSLNVTSGINIIKLEQTYGSSDDVESSTTSARATFSAALTPYNTTYSLNGIDVTGIQLTGSNTITINLPSTINSRIYLACRRISNTTTTINLKYGNTTRTITAPTATQGARSNQAINSNTFTISLANTGRGAYIYGFTTADNTNSYYYFQDMIYIDGVYYLPARTTTATTAANVSYTGTNVQLNYSRNGNSNTTINLNNVSTTATATTQTYTNTGTVNVQAVTGITNVNLVPNTVVSSFDSSTTYDNICTNIISSGTTNNYFSYTNNDLANQIIKQQQADSACKYNLEVSSLPSGAITNYTDAYNFFSITGTTQNYAQKQNNSATIAGKAYTATLQLPNSNAAYVSFNAAANSYLYIFANQNANANLVVASGANTYTINLNRADRTYAIKIKNAGTYRIYATGAAANVYDIYYATGTTLLSDTYKNTSLKGTYIKGIFTNYDNFYKYYQRNALFNESTNITASNFKYSEILHLLYATKYSDMDLYNKLTDEQIIEIIKTLFKYQDEFLASTISDTTLQYITRQQLINEISIICRSNPNFLIDVFNKANISISNITAPGGDYYSWVYRLIAAYVSTNYLMNYDSVIINNSTLTNTELYTIINSINGKTYTINSTQYTFTPNCQFISSDTTISGENFENLMNALGHDLSSTGYGIYALSSSHGKLNGEFIPDNLSLDTMDPEYTIKNGMYQLIEENEDIDTSITDAKWRGGIDDNEDYHANYTGHQNATVNQAFYDEMKQLIKSISTTVFDLTLDKGGNKYYGDIDLEAATITYYLPSLATGQYTVYNLDLAYRAKAYEGIQTTTSGTEFKEGSSITVNNVGSVAKFTVFAEDQKVYKTYDIIFKLLTTNLTMTYSDGTTSMSVPTSQIDKEVVLSITSDNQKLPKGFDLKPYLSLTDGTNTYSMNSEYVTISTLSTDHKIKADGTATATLTISYKLPAGTYSIVLSLCGEEESVTYIKEASHACEITSMKFNGNDVTFTNRAATSYIKFGRAYNNIELTDISGIYNNYYDFYLDNLGISTNASVTATVAKTSTPKTYYYDADDSVTYNITSYVITYVVTAEDGVTYNEYTHTLTELDPYNKNTASKYGDIYRAGTLLNDVNTSFDETVTNGTKNQTIVSFERGNEAYYRLKYDFANIYTLSNNITYTKAETTDSSLADLATFNLEYRGISADVNEFCDAGIYSFTYTYNNLQEWDITATDNGDGTYTFAVGDTSTITYTFPRLVINKTYSTDATLHSIVLIDAYKDAATASTVMDTRNLRPTTSVSAGEIYYQTLMTSSTNPIEIGDEIDYQHAGTDYSVVTYTDYYTVGTVSNAQLSNYAPTFDIEKHAMIFQSTTLAKLKNYGLGKQTGTDASILSDHTSTDGSKLFIYVPFTYINDEGATATKIFLVELNNKNLTNIYDDRFNGTGSPIASLSNISLDYIRNMKLDSEVARPTFTTGGVTYTLSDSCGDTLNNPSLYMDYIGNPLNDHFWYVSYVVFSEDYIRSTNSVEHIKFFHTALIDISNNVYFTIKVITPKDQVFTAIDQIYVTILGNVPKDKTNSSFVEKTVGSYVDKKPVTETDTTITYELIYTIQIMPSAYYYFYIDLPGGYVATTEITDPSKVFKAGVSSDYLNHIADYPGAYLPPSSLVVQRVPLTITVTRGDSSDSAWAIATSDIYTRLAVLVVNDNESNQ